MKFEYNDYILNIEEVKDNTGKTVNYKASCPKLVKFLAENYELSLKKAIDLFQQEVDRENQGKKVEFEYLGYVLKLGRLSLSRFLTNGGHCEELNYTTFNEDSNAVNIIRFKEYVDQLNYSKQQEEIGEELKTIEYHCNHIREQNHDPKTLASEVKELHREYGKQADCTLEDTKRIYFKLVKN